MPDWAVEGGVLRRDEPGWCGGGRGVCVGGGLTTSGLVPRRRLRSVGADRFSIRFTQQVDLTAGEYTFTTTSDDGVRVKVDGDLVIDKWVNQGPTTWTGVTNLTAGAHTIVVEYYEGGGGASIQANYTPSP